MDVTEAEPCGDPVQVKSGVKIALFVPPQVMQSLTFALQPAVTNVSLVWDLPKEASVTVLSPPIISIFQGQRSLVYAQLSGLVREGLAVSFLRVVVCMSAFELSACLGSHRAQQQQRVM